jgi:hypothetical protein
MPVAPDSAGVTPNPRPFARLSAKYRAALIDAWSWMTRLVVTTSQPTSTTPQVAPYEPETAFHLVHVVCPEREIAHVGLLVTG